MVAVSFFLLKSMASGNAVKPSLSDYGSMKLENIGIKGLRKNKFTFWRERRAGRCKAARRRQCGTSSRSANAADARPAPRPEGLPAFRIANFYATFSHDVKPENRQQNVKLFLRRP
jgi:hypothetical protein